MPYYQKDDRSYGPSPKKEPRIHEKYDGQNKKHIAYNNYEFSNYSNISTLGNLPGITARVQMNLKAREFGYNSEDANFDAIDKLELDKKFNSVTPEEEQSLRKEEKNLDSIIEGLNKNSRRDHARATFNAAKTSHQNMVNNDLMEDASKNSHTNRLAESRKRKFDSPNGPGYQGYER